MTTRAADPVLAVARVLRASTPVLAMLNNNEQRIYTDRLPDRIAANGRKVASQEASVLVKWSGGEYNAGYIPVHAFDIDVTTYGSTPTEARQLALTCINTLQLMETSKSSDGELFFSAVMTVGPIGVNDESTTFFAQSWEVLVGNA